MPVFSTDAAAVGDLFTLAMDAAVDPQRWQALCDLIADGHDAAVFMVYAYDHFNRSAPVFHGSRACWEELAVYRADLEEGRDQGDRVAYRHVAKAEPGRILSEPEFLGLPKDAELPDNPYRQRVLDATGARARFAFKVNDVGPFLDLAAFHTRGAGASVQARLAADTLLIHRILARAIEASRTISALAGTYALLCSFFDSLDFAVAFCDEDGAVLHANAHFRERANDANGFHLAAGRLRGRTAEDTARIAACIAAAFAGEEAPSRLSTAISRRDGHGAYVLRALPIRDGQVRRHAPCAMVFLLDPRDEGRLNADGLAAFDVLSPSEIEVCRLLIKGATTESIAQLRDTSAETVRSQIKSAHAKLVCRSRLDLQRLALLTAVPVHGPQGVSVQCG